MDWLNALQNTINYIEEHINDNIDYAEIAKQANCSNYYFQRIFSILCGMTLGDYIRCRRLTLAGNELSTSNAKVIDIAFKYCYESPESFTRAFSRFHGITPSEAKEKGAKLKSFSPFSVKISLSGGSIMNYKIVEKSSFDILERVETHSIENGANLKSIPAFWSRAATDGTLETLEKLATDKALTFGVCYNGESKDTKTFQYSIAVPCDNNTDIPNGFRKNTIPGRTWAVFECVGAMPDAVQNMWSKIVTEFFPTSIYIPTYEMDIEAYTDGDMDSADYRSEIWIPVTKKR